jgi:hypothetical protein
MPVDFSSTYSRSTILADGGISGELSMRLMVAADSPEHLWLPRMTVQAVLRDNARTRACSSIVTKPSFTSDCRSSRILADCLAFMSELIDAGVRTDPSRGPARIILEMSVFCIASPQAEDIGNRRLEKKGNYCDEQHGASRSGSVHCSFVSITMHKSDR